MQRSEIRESVTVDGISLQIVASELLEQEWELAIQHRTHVTNWQNQYFTSAEDALATGRNVIAREGARSFVLQKGVEYLSSTCRRNLLPFAIQLAIEERKQKKSVEGYPHTITAEGPWTMQAELWPESESVMARGKDMKRRHYHIIIPLGDCD